LAQVKVPEQEHAMEQDQKVHARDVNNNLAIIRQD